MYSDWRLVLDVALDQLASQKVARFTSFVVPQRETMSMASISTPRASTSSSKIADPKLEPVLDDEPVDLSDIERILAADATNVQREEEVRLTMLRQRMIPSGQWLTVSRGCKQANRILTAFKLNPYDILGVEKDITNDELRELTQPKGLS